MGGGGKGGGKVDYSAAANATAQSNALQKELYYDQKATAQPWLEAGSSAVRNLADRLGLSAGGSGDLLKTYTGQNLQDDPGYQFRMDQGRKALERQLAASNKYLTPQASKALMQYGQDYGSQEYNAGYNRYVNDQNNIFNRLAGISGVGQAQAGQVAAAGQNYGNQVGQNNMGLANVQMSAQQANANRNSLFGNILGLGAQAAGAYYGAGGSDLRLKENIDLMGEINGHNVYSFNYKTDPTRRFIGAMAHEVIEKEPDAVIVDDEGMMMVDYTLLGFPMVEVGRVH
jgi:hypothetical protein